VIGISEGIVLADRYRLVRRQAERGVGATWVAADTETGADVWVQFADRGGLAGAAGLLGRIGQERHAVPTVLDTGELRLIVDSQALAVNAQRPAPHATHVEIVVEFAVLRPLTGRALSARILRRALAPADALVLAAELAEALAAARAEGRSHGWLTADSVWLARRGGCVLDLALGLAFPDAARIEVDQEVTGYFAPERLAGGPASEAADVFALGWLLYEALIGHAALQAEYTKLVATAGAATTAELLALWRRRARAHVAELLEPNSPLALLLSAALAEHAADRPGFGAFAAGAREAAPDWIGAGALVESAGRARTGTVVAAAAAVAAAEAAVAVAAGMEAARMEAGPEVGAANIAVVSDEVAAALVVNSALGLDATAAALQEASLSEAALLAQSAANAAARAGKRRPMLAFTAVGSVAAIFAIGLVLGYAWGRNHGHGTPSSGSAFIGAPNNGPSATPGPVVAAAGASASAACATPPDSAAASVSASPTAQLTRIVQAAQTSGGITASTATQLIGAIGRVRDSTTGSSAYGSALGRLSVLIQSGQASGAIPSGTADTLADVLAGLYGPAGS
jgi:hypothetical protein